MTLGNIEFDANDADPDSEFVELLRAAKDGDQDAIGELLQNYRHYLLAIANDGFDPGIKNKMGASDIVQESMITANRHFQQFRGESEGELKAWLKQILKNDVVDARRAYHGTQKRQVDRERPLAYRSSLDLGITDPQLTPRSDALAREEAEQLNKAMGQLSEEYQQVLRLRNWDNLSFADIGQQMDRTTEAARKLWTRAILSLQKQIGNE